MKITRGGLSHAVSTYSRKTKLRRMLIDTVMNDCDSEFLDIYARYKRECSMLLQFSMENNDSLPEIPLQLILSHYNKRDNMSFKMARLLAGLGCFVTHHSFDSTQSMHMWHCDLYYEDGANLTATGFTDNLPNFLETGWVIKRYPERIDSVLLEEMHKANSGYMLKVGSYEDCFK